MLGKQTYTGKELNLKETVLNEFEEQLHSYGAASHGLIGYQERISSFEISGDIVNSIYGVDSITVTMTCTNDHYNPLF